MRLRIKRDGLGQILKWMQRALAATAILLFTWCAFVLVDMWAFQKRESDHLDFLLASQPVATEDIIPVPASASASNWPPVAANGLIGRMEISRLGLSVMVVEGTSSAALRRAVGHISGTTLPGEPGNMGISGHRDTFFRPLRHVREGDIITLTTLQGEYRYRVVSIRIVSPSDIEVLDAGPGEVLTLVTCHPFYFVGSAPDRFIVRAARLS